MLDTLTVLLENTDPMDKRIISQSNSLITKRLEDDGFIGIWRAVMIKRLRVNKETFAAKRRDRNDITGEEGVKIMTKPGGPDTSYEWLLVPPDDYNIDDVVATLKGESLDAPMPQKEEEEPAPEVVSIPANRLSMLVGYVFEGTVRNVTDYGAFIDLGYGVQGMVHRSAWSYRMHVSDMTKATKIGDTVKIMVTKIDNQGRLVFSKKDAENQPVASLNAMLNEFSGQVVDGKFKLHNFTKEEENRIFLLEVIADLHAEHIETKNGTKIFEHKFVDKNKIWSAWERAIRKKFRLSQDVEVGRVRSLMNAMTARGWVVKIEGDGRVEGYSLTDDGWREVGGKEMYGIGDKNEEAEPEIDLTEEVQEPPKPPKPQPIPTPEPKPILTTPVATQNGAPDTDLLAQYITKKIEYRQARARIAVIQSDLDDATTTVKLLQIELEDQLQATRSIEEWIAEHPLLAQLNERVSDTAALRPR